jgi:adenosylcobyric acid synthase
MVCGTSSHAGKSTLVAGLCRVLARRGLSVAPFKGQNMALNAAVTAEGGEIGRAQEVQARAAGVEPEVAMNPVLLKPTGERTSQVVVRGRPWRVLDAAAYQAAKAELVGVVDRSLADLRQRHDVVLLEGAGSPAEINLLAHDLVNLGLAARAGIRAVLVGDIERGGVFAHLLGTVELLPDALRPALGGLVINKFRGDPDLLADAPDVLAARTGLPVLGVVPWLGDLRLEAEDSLSLPGAPAGPGDLDVAVVRFPALSNFTDLDPLVAEAGVGVRWVTRPEELGRPDLVVLPGTKATQADLAWLRRQGLDRALAALVGGPRPPSVLGLCGGYQMLGDAVEDPGGVEGSGRSPGLGLLPVTTVFGVDKVTRRRRGRDGAGRPVQGYEIHHGVPRTGPGAVPLFFLDDGAGGEVPEGAGVGPVAGTSLHGLFEGDDLRHAFLGRVAAAAGRDLPLARCRCRFAAAREAALDAVADACEAALDLDALWALADRAVPA